IWYFDASNPSAPALDENCHVGGHSDLGPGPNGTYSFLDNGYSGKYGTAITPTGFQSISYQVNGFGQWAGYASSNFTNQMETYPSLRVYTNPPPPWASDWHPYQGGSAYNSNSGTGIANYAYTPITAGGQTHVWKITRDYPLKPKLF